MTLRVVYRSHGGENFKDRPDYYSKLLGLVSFLRAVDGMDAEVVFLNDGPIPDDRMRLMAAAGETIELPGVGMRSSYRTGLQLAASRWAPEDAVWFGEDDYLYHPDALRAFVRATEAIPDADYFALYGSTPNRPAERHARLELHRPAGWRDLPPWTVDGQDWVRIHSTASTFGARVGALAQDLGVFAFCMVPHRKMYRDHDTMLLLQGFEPYGYATVLRETVGLSAGGPRDRLRTAVLAPFRLATNLRAHRRPSRRRLLLAADPNLVTHMEIGWEAPGQDWSEVARGAREWGAQRGMLTEGSAVA